MFRQLFKYRLIGTLRVWQILFWNLVFPLALSTFLYLAMSSIMYPDPLEALPIQADNALVADVLKDVEFEGLKPYFDDMPIGWKKKPTRGWPWRTAR